MRLIDEEEVSAAPMVVTTDCTANEPKVPESSENICRRWRIVKFISQFDNQLRGPGELTIIGFCFISMFEVDR